MAQDGQRIDKASGSARRETNDFLDFRTRVAPANMPPFSKKLFFWRTIRAQKPMIGKSPVFIWRADKQKCAGTQDSKYFPHRPPVIRYMFHQIKHGDRIKTFVFKRQIGCISADKLDTGPLIARSRSIFTIEIDIYDLSVRIQHRR